MSLPVAEQSYEALLEPHRWTITEFEAMIEVGLITEESKVELLDGIITKKMGTGPLHDFVLRRLMRMCNRRLGDEHEVGAQSPVRLPPSSRPEPDLWVSRAGSGQHREATIEEADLALVIEVADSSIRRDEKVKLGIYARAGVPEFWIANVQREQITVYTQPDATGGKYGREVTYAATHDFDHALLGAVVVEGVFR